MGTCRVSTERRWGYYRNPCICLMGPKLDAISTYYLFKTWKRMWPACFPSRGFMLFSASPLSPLDRDPGNNHRPTTREPRHPPNTPGKAKQTQGGTMGGAAGAWKGGGEEARGG